MNTLSSLPGIGEAMDIIKRTFRRTLHRIDQQYDLKAVYKLKGKLDSIKPKLLDCRVEFARRFLEGSGDMVSFSHLAPVSVLSEWSAVALVRPTEVQSYAGVICQRSEFAVGKNLFTFWLKDGAISIEADARGKTSSLAPPLNQWSLIGATAASDGSAVYLGVNGKVETEDLPGLTTGSAGDDLPIAIGQLGSNFPGSIAFVALYSEKLSDPVMREICSGKLHAFRAPGIVFAWAPNEKIDTDRISDSAGSVSGTTLIDCDHD